PQDSGEWNIGETVKFGYYSQDGMAFDSKKRVIDAITELSDDIVLAGGERFSPMQFLQRFLFSPADQQKYIHTLSGGELCRLHLAAVLMQSPNFLVLDEPTNDLDIGTLGLLEEYLEAFNGCVIVISHDRFFLDSIVDHLFVFTGNGIVKDFPGNYTDYRKWAEDQKQQEAIPVDKKVLPQTRRQERPRKLSFKEKQLMASLERELDDLNNEKAELEDAFASGSASGDIGERSRRYEEVKKLIDEKELQWLELSEVGS
ncbi:MAG: ATP-binding cassette domain-containing protein, partial [Muribaculaceae bacterium]|nr:ATP-binding cassette domain-containing protein [Muribaculaceae bacterium]